MDSKIEEFYDREEHMSVQIKTLTEENIRSKQNNRDLHWVLRAKSYSEALGPAEAEEFLDAASDVNKTIRSLADDLSPATRSAMMLGAIGSQREVMMNFPIPRNLDSLPSSPA